MEGQLGPLSSPCPYKPEKKISNLDFNNRKMKVQSNALCLREELKREKFNYQYDEVS